MDSSGFVPWYDLPAREYPIKRSRSQRYGFAVPTSALARYPARSSAPLHAVQRPFPAQVWLLTQQTRRQARRANAERFISSQNRRRLPSGQAQYRCCR